LRERHSKLADFAWPSKNDAGQKNVFYTRHFEIDSDIIFTASFRYQSFVG
jgi:hypothetical protein